MSVTEGHANGEPKAQPIVRWAGGKRRLLRHILPRIPAHVCYVEPFAGGLAVFCAKPRSGVEVVNDTHEELVTLYRMVRWHPDALWQEIAGHVNARADFFAYLAQPGLTDLQRAARFLLRAALCFGGNLDGFGVQKTTGGGAVKRLDRLKGKIEALHRRLAGVIVENRDWRRVVEVYDGPETFHFFDPPYLNCNGMTYAGWTRAEMQALAEVLPTLKGRWLVTADAGESRDVFARWPQTVVERMKGNASAPGHAKRYAEIIVTPN